MGESSSHGRARPPSAAQGAPEADVCLIVEGGYPYLLGGVATWVQSFINSFPDKTFHIWSLRAAQTVPQVRYEFPPNVVGFTEVVLDRAPAGRPAGPRDTAVILDWCAQFERVISRADAQAFAHVCAEVERSGFGAAALLESRAAWRGMEAAYSKLTPAGPIVDFFWTWRNFAVGLISIASGAAPKARLFHATSTGYAAVAGARAKRMQRRPFVVTEHGIYTNERRMDLAIANWIFETGASGYDATFQEASIGRMWASSFQAFSKLAYDSADAITTQYTDNKLFQRADGAPAHKQVIIPNGIDTTELEKISPDLSPRRPTVALLGRVVPIKDVRTYILSAALLRKRVKDVDVLIIGPQDEDPAYAAECRELVEREGLQDTVRFLGRVPDVKEYFAKIDVLALTSLSEAQPLALLEAGAAGVPAVTTDVGSCREILEGLPADGVHEPGGIVAPACDPEAIANALAEILLDKDKQRSMARAMRRRVVSYYNKTRIDSEYRALYSKVTECAGRSRPLSA